MLIKPTALNVCFVRSTEKYIEATMPPKMKVLRAHRSSKSCTDSCHKNPRVILRPLLADFSIQNRYRFNSPPPSASLYNKPELSDIKLKVGNDTYYGHKLILSAASEVFSRMLNSDWLESHTDVLKLEEEEECIKVFDLFLYYIYTGTIVLSESYVVPLYMLADKYHVTVLLDECVKIIRNGLKIFITKSGSMSPAASEVQPLSGVGQSFAIGPSSHSSSSGDSASDDLTDSEASHDHSISLDECSRQSASRSSTPDNQPGPSQALADPPQKTVLVASETFSLPLVMRLILTCHNESISNAALYNLEVRLANQISLGVFSTWNELDQVFLTRVLSDRHFYCKEFYLFRAVISWLQFDAKRQTEDVITDVLQHVRFPLLKPCYLYQVEQDDLVSRSSATKQLIQEAIRYQLFKSCCHGDDRVRWTGPQFEERLVRRP